MISIIISTYKPILLQQLGENIGNTIGNITYEIIAVDNPGKMGICEAYNNGVQQARYDYFVFCHEDILFHTPNWGENLIQHLQNPRTGVVGIAGSCYVPYTPNGWHLYDDKYNRAYYIQNDQNGNDGRIQSIFIGKGTENIAFALDGVFLAVRKIVYKEHPFNEELKGFHGYDLEFSLSIAKKYQNIVVNDILLEHFSKGNFNTNWFVEMLKARSFVGKYNYSHSINKDLEYTIFYQFFIYYLKRHSVSRKSLQSLWIYCPFRIFRLSHKIKILKLFYYYSKYQNDYNKKFENESKQLK